MGLYVSTNSKTSQYSSKPLWSEIRPYINNVNLVPQVQSNILKETWSDHIRSFLRNFKGPILLNRTKVNKSIPKSPMKFGLRWTLINSRRPFDRIPSTRFKVNLGFMRSYGHTMVVRLFDRILGLPLKAFAREALPFIDLHLFVLAL